MKAICVGEYVKGDVAPATYELLEFAGRAGAQAAMVMAGEGNSLPAFDGRLYLAGFKEPESYAPDLHKKMILEAVEREKPDLLVFSHSPYGWDLAPRVAFSLGAAMVSNVVDAAQGSFIVPALNGKLRREIKPSTEVCVVTLQAGAFVPQSAPSGEPEVVMLDVAPQESRYSFGGFEEPPPSGVDLTKAEVIVAAGRGLGKEENMALANALAEALHGQVGATRPVVDAGWLAKFRQIGASGVTVSPSLYIACGVSGAVQHLAGMRKSGFVVSVNTDLEAPIAEVSDVFVPADAVALLPALTGKIKAAGK